MLYENIKSNPSPRFNSSQIFSTYHWNLGSIPVHNFSEISLLKVVYNAIHIYGIICLVETYTNQDTLFEDDNLSMLGYELSKVNHPSNQKQGGIFIYNKHFLPIKVNDVDYLKECLNFNLSVNGK